MPTGALAPTAIQQFFDANGDPLSGGKLASYLAGTDTPSPLYSDPGLTIALANPVVLDAAGRTPTELFMAALSYKLVLKDALGATIWTADNVMSGGLLVSQAFAPTMTSVPTGGAVHNLATGVGHMRIVSCTNPTSLTITGFEAGANGDTILVLASGAGHVFLGHEDAGSAPTNRMSNTAHSGPTPLSARFGTALYQYVVSAQRWILIQHEQGQSITVPWVTGNYFSDVGSWTVPESSQITQTYYLRGAQLTITVTIGPSTVTGAPQALISAGWPFTFDRFLRVPMSSNNPLPPLSGWGPIFGVVDSGSVGRVYFVLTTFGAWTAAANVNVWGQMVAEVQ